MISLYILAAAGLFYIFSSPSVYDPIFNFLLAGVLPGSETAIAPNKLIWIAVTVVLAVLLSALAIWLVRISRVRCLTSAATVSIKTPISLPVTEEVIFSRSKEKTVTQKTQVFVTAKKFILQHVRLVLSDIRLAFDFLKRTCRVMAAFLRIYLIALLRIIVTYTVKFAAVCIIVFEIISATVVSTSITFWRWLRPRVARFDTWLELRYRSLVVWLRKGIRQLIK